MSSGERPLRIVLLVASTRTQGRFADLVLPWLQQQLAEVEGTAIDVVDLRDHPLPAYDLLAPPARAFRQYETAEQRELGERFDAADGLLVLTNEFNHGYPASLKNVLDHFFAEFVHKPVAFIGYGNVGGARAIEQLRLVVAELDMVSVRETVNILGGEMRTLRTAGGEAVDAVWWSHLPKLHAMLDNLLWWSRTLRAGRETGA
jgi:NAD(P)H-dependent FMN reductase